MSKIIDSAHSWEEACGQNPQNPASETVRERLVLLDVRYFGFDGEIHRGQVVVHRAVASDVAAFFTRALEIRFPIAKVIPIALPPYRWDDDASCEDNNTSGYNYRTILGTNELSKHAHGLAFDVNPRQNVYLRFNERGEEIHRSPRGGVYDASAPGTLMSNHELVRLMKERGWTWGGDWVPSSGRVDYQHFEKQLDE